MIGSEWVSLLEQRRPTYRPAGCVWRSGQRYGSYCVFLPATLSSCTHPALCIGIGTGRKTERTQRSAVNAVALSLLYTLLPKWRSRHRQDPESKHDISVTCSSLCSLNRSTKQKVEIRQQRATTEDTLHLFDDILIWHQFNMDSTDGTWWYSVLLYVFTARWFFFFGGGGSKGWHWHPPLKCNKNKSK